jgi:sugar lactone lactonase YvrE
VLILTIGKSGTNTEKKNFSQSTAISYQSVSFGSTERGYQDGAISTAKFNAPGGITVDDSSNMYISDSGNNVIRKIDSQSSTVTTIAGSTTNSTLADGTGSAAQFNNPNGIAISKNYDYLVVADVGNNAIRKIMLSSGLVSTIGGGSGAFGDSNAGKGLFNQPYAVTVDSWDNVYVADTSNNRIRRIDANGLVTNFGDNSFREPKGIAVDKSGNVFVADTGNGAIKKINASGSVSNFLATNSITKRDSISLTSPIGLAVDANGNVYVVDQNNGVLFINATTRAISSFSQVSVTGILLI